MRAPLAKAVRKEFATRLKEVVPEFVEAKGENIPPGDRLFLWEVSDELRFYLLLQFHPYEDWFTLEVAVSRSGHWPAFALLPNSPEADVRDNDLRFRLGRLWAPPQQDVWWELAPRPECGASMDEYMKRVPVDDLFPRVKPLVDDAVQRVVEYGAPYFQRAASERQIDQGRPR